MGSNVKYYLTRRGRWQRTRDVSHYNFVRIHATFLNHHWSAFLHPTLGVYLLSIAGAFNEKAFYDIPAGASLCLAFQYWSRSLASSRIGPGDGPFPDCYYPTSAV